MGTVIIGLDGADWQILEPLINKGKLPAIKRLVDSGCRGILRSTIPPSSPPAWASMITGVNPGKHGIFDFTIIDENYRKVPVDMMSKLGAAPLWRILNTHGITTGVVNLPILYPAEPVNGYLVCGMVTPWDAQVFTFPENLSQAIGNPGKHWIIGERLARSYNLEEFLLEIKEKTEFQADFVVKMLYESKTSFLMVVFDGSDKAQHFYWKFRDHTHPRHDPQANEALRNAIDAYYKDLDTHIGRIVGKIGESNVFVVSDHGFTNMSQDFYIEQWLLEEGYLQKKPTIATAPNRAIKDIVRGLWRFSTNFQSLKNKVKSQKVLSQWGKQMKATINKTSNLGDDIDWSKTRVFFAGTSSQALRINLKGREELGIVHDGEEYTNLVEELKSRLLQINDPESQSPVISEVYHRNEVFHGSRVIDAPDLIIISAQGYALQEGFLDHLLGPSVQFGRDRSGGHRREGIFIASGPGVRQSNTWIEADIVDIMPTTLYLNGLPIPDYVDGNVMISVIQKSFQENNPIKFTDAYQLTGPHSESYTEEERALLEDHLRALGYF